MTLRSGLLAATLLVAAPVAAKAQAVSGLYIGAGAGANFMHNQSVDRISFPELGIGQTRIGASARMDVGFVGLVSVGYGFGNGLRAEVEGSYRSNDLDSLETRRINGALMAHPGAKGRVASYAVMANLLYDFDLGGFGLPLRPYVGAGVGYGWLQHDDVTADAVFLVSQPGRSTVLPGRVTSDGTGGAFAYQAIGGIAAPLRLFPGFEVTAEYRYFAMSETRISGERAVFGATGGIPPAIGGKGHFDNHNHSILVGLRYVFN